MSRYYDTLNLADSLRINNTTVIDSARNLTNIASISASGGISVSGYNTISSYAGSFNFITGSLTGNVTGTLTGNASSATKWATARTLSLTGDVTGSVSIDGSANASITTVVANDSHSHSNYVLKTGDTMSGTLAFSNAVQRDKVDLNGSDAHCLGWESYNSTYGANTWNSGFIGHKFYANSGTLIANIGTGGSTTAGSTTSSFYGKLTAGYGTSNLESGVARFGGQSQNGEVNALSLVNSVTGATNNAVSLAFHNAYNYSPTGKITTVQRGAVVTDSSVEIYGYNGGLLKQVEIDYLGNLDVIRGGLQVNGTTVIDSSRNLTNIGTITASSGMTLTGGNILFNNNTVSGIRNSSGNAGYRPQDAYGNTYMYNTVAGKGYYGDFEDYYFRNINGTVLTRLNANGVDVLNGGFRIAGTTVIDSSRNLTNIASLTLSGNNGAIKESADTFNNLVIGSGNTALRFINNSGQRRIIPRDLDDTAENGTIDLGDSGSRFRDIHLSTGVVLSGTRVIDSSRNLTNIGKVNAGAITNDNTGAVRILHPDGASYTSNGSTGYIKITLPVAWTDTMMRMTVKVYEYTTGESFEVCVGGYNHTGGGGLWYNTFAHIISDPDTNRNFTVRYGHDGTKACIWIGEADSVWSYPKVSVVDFQAGHGNANEATWATGWSVGIGSAIGTVQHTHTNNEVGIDGYEKRIGGVTVIDSSRNLTNIGTISASGNSNIGGLFLGNDGTYSGYDSIGFSGNTNGHNRIFGYSTTGGGMYVTSATGQSIHFRTDGGTSDQLKITSANEYQHLGLTWMDGSRNLTNIGNATLSGVINLNRSNQTANAISINNVRDSSWSLIFTTNDVGNDNHSGFWVGSNGYPDMRLRRDDATVRALISSWETSYVSNNFDVKGGDLKVGGTTVIDSARNATVNKVVATAGGMSEFSTDLSSNDDWQNSPISIRERNMAGSLASADMYAPNLNFHWAGRASNSLWMNSAGHLVYGGYGATGIPEANGVLAAGAVRTNTLTDLADTSTFLELEGDSLGMRLQTASGYFRFGSRNSTWCHMDTDRSGFYFYKKINVVGTTNSTTGYQVNGTTVIDASRNLTNIGTIGSGAITASSITTGTNGNISTGTGGNISAFGNVTASNGFVKSGSGGFYVSSTQIVDSNRNLTNIASGTFGGNIDINTSTENAIDIYENSGASGFTYMRFLNTTGSTMYGRIYRSYSSLVYSTSSDYRLKENVVDLTNATDRIKLIPVRRFNFIEHPDRTVDGFLAHEVQAVVPEAIIGEKDEVDDTGSPVYQGIDQSKLVPLLTAGLQEALAEIENLKARLSALEN